MKLAEGIRIEKAAASAQASQHMDLLFIENAFCQAKIALQGGQVLTYQQKTVDNLRDYPPLLWVTDRSYFTVGKAIRGGIPLCFPWFGTHPTRSDFPAHGFARQSIWQLHETQFDPEVGHRIVLQLRDTAFTRQYWPHAFILEMTIICGTQLSLQMRVENTDQNTFEFSFAWHSYFAVSDVRQIHIKGLEDVAFIDQLQSHQQIRSESNAALIDQEVDRIYLDAGGQYQIVDQNSSVQIQSAQAKDVVLWNPWIEKTQRLSDVTENAWIDFVCLECGKVKQSVQLAAGQQCSFELTLNLR